jgi:hypothetical protein
MGCVSGGDYRAVSLSGGFLLFDALSELRSSQLSYTRPAWANKKSQTERGLAPPGNTLGQSFTPRQ